MKTLDSPIPTEPRDAQSAPPARRTPAAAEDDVAPVVGPLLGSLIGVVVMIAIGIVMWGPSSVLAALSTALLGTHSAWYLSRASAFVAYLLLWLSMVLGLTMTNRLARVWPGGPTAGALHEQTSLLGLGFGVLHALVLLGDQYSNYTLAQLLVPFAAGSYRPLWVGLGQVGLYMMALVTFSFYVRRWIGARTWRVLHYLSFALFAIVLAHGLFSGTDSGSLWAVAMYLGTGLSVIALTIYRVLVPSSQRSPAASPAK
jgi:predicted ferric reductase